jgi:precorrin-4/cobalt-precorrin-4 C11-methyltransferase
MDRTLTSNPEPFIGVSFVGAGPGAADLITVRGKNTILNAQLVLYAGSLVSEEILSWTQPSATVIDSSSMVLDDIIDTAALAYKNNQAVARVHSGDPSLYGAIFEQIERLHALNIPTTIIPGVPAFAAAAAALGTELSIPNVVQSVVLTRTSVRSTSMPNQETLENFAKTGATLAIHLSINNLASVVKNLSPILGDDCPVAVLYRVSWPDQQIITGNLKSIREQVKKQRITRTALILVGKGLLIPQDHTSQTQSSLYNPSHHHIFRKSNLSSQ